MTRSERLDNWEIPLHEISALCVRHDPSGGPPELLVVGDERWAVAAMALAAAGAEPKPTTEVAPAIAAGGLPTDGKSEFEGVASDASGRVFLLQEGPARVLVLDRAMAVLQHTITLDVAAEEPEIGASWADEPNARGEGVLLLREGHMLIAKQRDPVRLIEFGPAGDAPLGYAPGRALADDEDFALADSDASVVEVLATWSLDPAANVESINDLAVDIDGSLHLVSSRSRCIGLLDADLTPGEDVVAASTVSLDAVLFKDRKDKAEGLVFTDALGWLVALDLQRAAPNLHELALFPG